MKTCSICNVPIKNNRSSGLCRACYLSSVKKHNPICISCGQTKSKHAISGLCWDCYNKARVPREDGKRFCPKCDKLKPMMSFTPTSVYCKSCLSTYTNNKWKKLKEEAVAYKGGKCVDCGLVAPSWMYDFHHKDPSQKDFSISKVRTVSLEIIKPELDKCDLLCANCHRTRHFA